MLGFLLFAGALHIDLGDLSDHKWPIAVLATFGVVLSTGDRRRGDLGNDRAGLRVPAPVHRLPALRRADLADRPDRRPLAAQTDRRTEAVGDSDRRRVAVQRRRRRARCSSGLLEFATGEQKIDPSSFATLFVREAVGGALFGLAAGLMVYRLLKSVDHYRLEILLSLALVFGGYALAEALGLSAPIAMVVAGLLIGNHGRSFAMSAATTEHIDRFWGLLDELLNAVLFVMIGMEVLVLIFTPGYLLAGLTAVAVVLLARAVSVGVPVWLLRRGERFEPSMIPMLTWGGLRGGISVALALSLRDLDGVGADQGRELILATTYVVVVFSILVQGLTVGWLTRFVAPRGPEIPQTLSSPGSSDCRELWLARTGRLTWPALAAGRFRTMI